MTEFTNFRSQRRDIQDGAERGVYGTMENVAGAGMMMSVKGTGTLDTRIPVMNFGYGFNLPANSNAEVIMMSLGSDVNDKVAIPTLPRDLQYQWPEGSGGIQNPLDPANRIEMDGTGTHLTDGNYTVGPNAEVTITVAGGNVTISIGGDMAINAANLNITGDVNITGDLNTNGAVSSSGSLTNNGTNVGSTHTHVAPFGGGVTTGPA